MKLRRFLLIAVAVFSLAALWFGIYTYGARRNDLDQRASVETAISLADRRLSQANDLFEQYRATLDVLAQSDELYLRQVTFAGHMLISVRDESIYWMQEWQDIPWLSPSEAEAAAFLLSTEIQGSRDVSIVFSEYTMTFTIFATPLHQNPPRAWVVLRHGNTLDRAERRVVQAEELEGEWNLAIISEQLRNEATPYLIITIIIAILAIASTAVLIWGIKTYRFIAEPNNIFNILLIIGVAIALMVLLSAVFLTN